MIDIGAKVSLGEKKGAYRVIKLTHLRGEKAVELVRPGDWTEFNKNGRDGVTVARTVHIADLVRVARGWRERWRQQEMEP